MIGTRAAAAAIVLLFVAACEAPMAPSQDVAAPQTRVAIIDLDAVAAAIGADTLFKEQLDKAGAQMSGQLTEYAKRLRDEINAEREKVGTAPSAEDQQRIVQLAAAAQLRIQQGQQAARQKAQALRTELVNRFRDEVAPFAERVARERGLTVVLNDSTVVWIEPAQDITAAVIEAMQGAGAKPRIVPKSETGEPSGDAADGEGAATN